MDFAKISDEIISNLKTTGIIERVNEIQIKDNPNSSIIKKMFSTPSKIFLDDKGLFFYDGEDKIYCPEMYVTVSEKGEWLSDMIPNIEFDIDQSGNVRKAEEAEALFCLIVVANTLQDETFKNEIEEISKNYDFTGMRPNNAQRKNFISLLSEWQSLQSVIINILVSACRYRLNDYKKDVEKFLKDGLKDSEVVGLRDLDAKIRKINFEYSEGVLSSREVKKLTKIERLSKIDERDSKIKECVNNSKFGTLYSILKLSTEYISPVKKKKIQIWVDAEVTRLLDSEPFRSLKEERINIISQLTRRALRIERNSVRRLNIEGYINDGSDYKLPSKM